MTDFLIQSFLDTIKPLDRLIDSFIKPNPKYVDPSNIEQEFTNRRRKTFVVVHIILFAAFSMEPLFVEGTFYDNLFRCILVTMHLCFLYISCRTHPHIFKIYYTIICVVYGLFFINTGPDGVHIAYFATHLLAMFAYLSIGSIRYYIIQLALQSLISNVYYPKKFEEAIVFMTPEKLTQAMSYANNLNTMFFIVLMIITDYFMQQAFHKITTTEKKKTEFENQKTFLLGFSHELRNLINSLTGNVKLVKLEALTDRAKELLLNAEVCGELLLHLINNILDTGKVEIGDLEITYSPTRMSESLEKIWGVCSELIKRKNLHGRITIQKSLPKTIMTDHYRLIQIFLNLVGNAIKFTDSGSIDLNVEWIDRYQKINDKCFEPYPYNEDDQDEGLFTKKQMFNFIDPNYFGMSTSSRKPLDQPWNMQDHHQTRNGILKVTVRDPGYGIPKDQLENIFLKFTQVTNDISKRKLGTGLGLFITRQLCQRMQGDIRAYSKEGEGSCFIFCIPAEVVYERTHDFEILKQKISQKKLTSMLVDDITFNQTVLRGFFDKLNVEVVDIAVNGLEALQKFSQRVFKRSLPHIITMDLDMPIMDGKEASRKIRQLELEHSLEPCYLLIIS